MGHRDELLVPLDDRTSPEVKGNWVSYCTIRIGNLSGRFWHNKKIAHRWKWQGIEFHAYGALEALSYLNCLFDGVEKEGSK